MYEVTNAATGAVSFADGGTVTLGAVNNAGGVTMTTGSATGTAITNTGVVSIEAGIINLAFANNDGGVIHVADGVTGTITLAAGAKSGACRLPSSGLTATGFACAAPSTVVTHFLLGGTVEDIGAAEQTAIKKVIAEGAGVPTSAVSLTLSPGSVLVRAEILLKDDATATAAENALSGANGILENAASLQAALIAQFQADGIDTTDLTVEGLVQAPPPSPPGSPGDGGGGGSCGVGCIVGIVFGVFALLALSALLFLFLTGAACFKKVDGGYATGKPGAAGAAEAAEAA
ncbi:hypothetical protein EMIHUDRAFT_433502 [Emiliania huxleyi CCMP1516]|uniref:Uncharacterized protein n=2 Tax=Emiliania huxleyi TaxID=2903 RepID=A0A0D3KQE7_EMIH1|nr:hypothetical protein EMIHUDRAFT_433502 [Emiliania huxleyi CCMP1516]EOD37982.1 hypothetical protein EMIHUDRAFT_433502 [Emiliania huxleyi CCMP1516]|eukprot:XP_005790411.1 hypothetical protein EMIHUDRAFT_433502 [Emiliania huxleyi CCMP1516]